MPEHYPSFPHHSDIKAYLDDYADAFGLLENIEFGNGVASARRRGRRRMGHRGPGGRRAAQFDLLVVANGHHWDPRLPDFPGTFTASRSTPTTTSTRRHPLELTGKRILVVGLGNSAADITVELSSKALQNKVTLSTRSSAWIVPKYIAGRPGDTLWRTSPHLPLSWQRKAIQLFAPVMGVDPTMYGLPAPNHKLFEAHPTQSVELPLRLGSGDVIPKPNVARLDGDTVHFDRRHQRRVRRHHLRHRLQHHVPVLRSRTSSARRTTRSGCTSGCSSRVSTIWRSSASRSRCRRCSRSWSASRGCSPPTRSGATRCRRPPEMERVIDADQQLYTGHCTDSARHTQQVDYFHYEHDMRTREIPAGIKRAAARRPAGAAYEVADRPPAAAAQRPPARGHPRRARRLAAGVEPRRDQHRRDLQAGRRDALGVLLLLREQGRRGGRADGAHGRRDVRRQRRLHRRRPIRRDGASTPCSTGCSRRCERHRHLFKAMLEARGSSASVRDIWDDARESFVESVAEMIRADRAAGRAPDGVDADVLAVGTARVQRPLAGAADARRDADP